MKIGINVGAVPGLPADRAVGLMAENGFRAAFCMSDFPDMESVQNLLSKSGIECENLHAPFGHINDIWLPGEGGDAMLGELIAGVDTAARYAIPLTVVHLSSGPVPPPIGQIGIDRYRALLEHAERVGVKIAFENQRLLGVLCHAMEVFPEAAFCFDVGHEQCFMHGEDTVALWGSRIGAVHVHDNHKKHNKDEHMIPFDGAIDYEDVARRIARTRYDKALMLEVFKGNSAFYEEISPEDFFHRAADAARRVADLVRIQRRIFHYGK